MITSLASVLHQNAVVINMVVTAIACFGALWVLFGHEYQLTGNRIPVWHRAPLFIVALGCLWVTATSFVELATDTENPMSYAALGVIGEALINGGLAVTVLAFTFHAWRKAKQSPKKGRKK